MIQSTDDSSIKASPSTLQPEKNRESVEQSSSDTNDEYGLGFEGHDISTPSCDTSNGSLSNAFSQKCQQEEDQKVEDDDASLNAFMTACSVCQRDCDSNSTITAATGVAAESDASSNSCLPAAAATTPASLTTGSNLLASPNTAPPLNVSNAPAEPVDGAIHFASAAPVPSVAASQRASALLADSTSCTVASASSNSVSDAPPKPLLNETKVSIISEEEEEDEEDGEEEQEEEEEDDYISEGNMSDASSTIESEGISIEGHFNVRVHNTLPEYSCGFFSLLEAAKCLTASYSLEVPDDALSLRKAIVDFIRTNLDTCCEGGGFGRTWREEIALKYFSENQDLPSPQSDLLWLYRTDVEGKIFVKSINDYLEAMANPLICIDQVALMAFARIWDVRVVMFDRTIQGWTSDGSQYVPAIKYLDEEKSIYLVSTGQRVKWAHADGYNCGVESCRESGKRISAHHEFLNYPCDDKSLLHSVTTSSASLRMIFDRITSQFGDLSNLVRGIHSAHSVSSGADCLPMDVTENAIRVLVALNSGLHMTSLEMEYWCGHLRNRGSVLSQMYREKDFDVMVDETIELLKQYSGRQILGDRDLDVFHQHLKTYGWVLSPQMWTREEIIVMCVILLDPNNRFNNILQKITQVQEKDQNRGMACLDPRVQAIMYLRLKHYKFVRDDEHLPIDIPAAVVLNSGGSYLHLGTWIYPVNCRFVVDDKVDQVILHVTGTPDYTYCDGLFMATKTRRANGRPVYVSLSPTQFFGPSKKDKPYWDSLPLKKYISKDHVLHEWFSAKRCKGKSFPAERVLYWEGGKAVFQSVTAYGTEMKLLTVDCEKLGVASTTTWSRINNFDFKNKMSIMVPGLTEAPQISCIQYKGTIVDPEYTFACGTKREAVLVKKSVLESKPKPTKKQSFHKDGPTLYDGQQFDCHGNILPNARGDTKRTIPLPPGNSVSALFAFFCRTFLGINPIASIDLERSCNTGGLRLHASIGRAIIFYFDTDHQVWRHKICETYVHMQV